MRFIYPFTPTKTMLKSATTTDPLRPAMAGIYYDVDESRLVATDGNIMVTYPVMSNEDDVSCVIPIDAFSKDVEEIRTSMSSTPEVAPAKITVVTKSGIIMMDSIPERFPSWKSVWPNFEYGSKTQNPVPLEKIKFNAHLIGRLTKVIPKVGRDTASPVVLQFYGQNKGVIFETVMNETGPEIKGIIMPMSM